MRTTMTALLFAAALSAQQASVINLEHSPNVRLRPVPVKEVKFGEGFWAERRKVNVEKSLPTMLELLEEHGIMDNFRRLSGHAVTDRKGPLYTDSDLYKWIEAVGFVLQSGDNPTLRAALDKLIPEIVAAQEPSGYLNTYYVEDRAKLRFTEMQRSHELYCLGHLLQAAIAVFRANGDRRLLDAGIRFVDYLVATSGPDKRPLLTGHPEFEMAVIELYRTTGKKEYLDLAGYLLSGVETERLYLKPSDVRYMFSGAPFTSRTKFEGHAVRALYAACGAADYYAETGQKPYRDTLDTLWEDMTKRKMFVTGGVGSRAQGEAFGDAYELPNQQAYTESCAAIANLMWNFRMLNLTGDARYANVMERALYNGINSGMSLSGTMYCYRNPLASEGEKIRNAWYDTTCCPPNLQRLFASLPGYIYGTAPGTLYVHFFHSNRWEGATQEGEVVALEQTTNYPWDGDVELRWNQAPKQAFTLRLRAPDWCDRPEVFVNGQKFAATLDQGYLTVKRSWKNGDKLRLSLPMKPRWIAANPRVSEAAGKLALQKGPLVYCLEQQDQPGMASLFDALVDSRAPIEAEPKRDLLGGITVLRVSASAYVPSLASLPLYMSADAEKKTLIRPQTLTFIPYYAWANREPGAMEVWVSERP